MLKPVLGIADKELNEPISQITENGTFDALLIKVLDIRVRNKGNQQQLVQWLGVRRSLATWIDVDQKSNLLANSNCLEDKTKFATDEYCHK